MRCAPLIRILPADDIDSFWDTVGKTLRGPVRDAMWAIEYWLADRSARFPIAFVGRREGFDFDTTFLDYRVEREPEENRETLTLVWQSPNFDGGKVQEDVIKNGPITHDSEHA